MLVSIEVIGSALSKGSGVYPSVLARYRRVRQAERPTKWLWLELVIFARYWLWDVGCVESYCVSETSALAKEACPLRCSQVVACDI